VEFKKEASVMSSRPVLVLIEPDKGWRLRANLFRMEENRVEKWRKTSFSYFWRFIHFPLFVALCH
jgi:hypothetical protein